MTIVILSAAKDLMGAKDCLVFTKGYSHSTSLGLLLEAQNVAFLRNTGFSVIHVPLHFQNQ
jgi:hypothetical protein